jgi:EAL domain-containing protein (putative c-di-GMP-specific phosphodiesterase class I)
MAAMLEWEMLWLARLRASQRLPTSCLLFVNAPAMDRWPDWGTSHRDHALPDHFPWDRCVVEVSERTPISNLPAVSEVRSQSRQSGVRFALDDVGAGYAGLAALALLEPDYVKVDATFIRRCDIDAGRQAVVVALVQYARRTGAWVIAEGVETPGELEAVRAMGVDYVQGYLIARPAESPPEVDLRWFDGGVKQEALGHRLSVER